MILKKKYSYTVAELDFLKTARQYSAGIEILTVLNRNHGSAECMELQEEVMRVTGVSLTTYKRTKTLLKKNGYINYSVEWQSKEEGFLWETELTGKGKGFCQKYFI